MAGSPLAPHTALPAELRERVEAERRGTPFLVFRDPNSRQRILELAPTLARITVGRRPTNDVALPWDSEVSRVHAELERIGDDWTLADDGLSRNGSFVNDARLSGRWRLKDGDRLRFGGTTVVFCAGQRGESLATLAPESPPAPPELTEAQRRVLVALCRPFKSSGPFAIPAANQQIAAELYISVDTVKTHLRSLYAKLGLEELPQNHKRVALVERAFAAGLVSEQEL